jgi:broad specificity phosphatase PhoE
VTPTYPESESDMRMRCALAIQALLDTSPDGNIVIVTHGSPVSAILHALAKVPSTSIRHNTTTSDASFTCAQLELSLRTLTHEPAGRVGAGGGALQLADQGHRGGARRVEGNVPDR